MYNRQASSAVAEFKALGLDVDFLLVPKAGHHLYMDNADAFVASL